MRATGESTIPPSDTNSTAAENRTALPSGLKRTLKTTFGLTELRPGQDTVIHSVLEGFNTLAIMPTGSGKSLCYQLPALGLPGLTIVVSPLIALMKDQAEKLENVGVDTAQLNSTLNAAEEQAAMENLEQENTEIVFVTPERLVSPGFLETLKQSKIDLLVIDEAHCISKWGHDFRPSYLMLQGAIQALGQPPVLALTATATEEVIQDISRELGIDDMRVINTGIYRENLHYSVKQATSNEEKLHLAVEIIRNNSGCGIIYAATIKAAEQLHAAIRQAGEDASLYHGQLSAKQRTSSQDDFMEGRSRIMVATNAFGMGIDKPDIRFVVHFQMPASLEAYYQESGRVGRDGIEAHCILLYHADDKRIQQFFLAKHHPDASEISAVYSTLKSLTADSAASVSTLHEKLAQDFSLLQLQVVLKLLAEAGIIEQNDVLEYRILDTYAKASVFDGLAKSYSLRNERDRQALDRMVFYAQTGFCRWRVMLEYFGEDVDWDHCESCDNCLHPPEENLSSPQKHTASISHLPEQHRPVPAEAEFHEGQNVTVPKYGSGKVISVESEKVTIVFPDSQTRTFLAHYVKTE